MAEKIVYFPKYLGIFHLPESINKSAVSLNGHSHGGVDTGSEGDVDEGHQDGDGLEQGEVLEEG